MSIQINGVPLGRPAVHTRRALVCEPDLVEITGRMVARSDRALLLETPTGYRIWLPLAHIDWGPPADADVLDSAADGVLAPVIVSLPRWLAADRGLDPAKPDPIRPFL